MHDMPRPRSLRQAGGGEPVLQFDAPRAKAKEARANAKAPQAEPLGDVSLFQSVRETSDSEAAAISRPAATVAAVADADADRLSGVGGSVATGKPEPTPIPRAKWTVFNYCAADNNLYAYIYDDVASMEQVGSTGSVQVVTQFDHRDGGGAYRFRVEKDGAGGDPKRIDSPVLQALGNTNMSDPATLTDFLVWGMKKFPSEKTMLLIADHGKGWQGAIQDDGHKGWMSLPQIGQALSDAEKTTGRKLDVIGFDACQMASVEVASELKDRASFMVASQALEGREGWPYQHLMTMDSLGEMQKAHLFKSDVEARQVAEMVVRGSADHQDVLPTMSAIDLSQVGALEDKLRALGGALAEGAPAGPDLRQLRSQVQSFGFYSDLGDFLRKLESWAGTRGQSELQAHAAECLEQLSRTVVAEQHSAEYPAASGLTVELKQSDKDYGALQFAAATGWPQTIGQFSRNA